MLFWLISGPKSPRHRRWRPSPAVEDLRFQNSFVASSVLGMLALRHTLHPSHQRGRILSVDSFCVALGKAQSALMAQSGLKPFDGSTGMYFAVLK